MFKRKKVHPEADAYASRRYEDTAVCIHYDIKGGRGLYNFYAPWLEMMLQRLPAGVREKHSLMVTPAWRAPRLHVWGEEQFPAESGPSNQGVGSKEGDLPIRHMADFANKGTNEATHAGHRKIQTLQTRNQSKICVIL